MTDDLVAQVRSTYARAALAVNDVSATGCCGSPTALDGGEQFGGLLYDAADVAALPDTAYLASLGCGNPTAVADLRPGETVLDIGSGGGIDVGLAVAGFTDATVELTHPVAPGMHGAIVRATKA
jgi:arsenite methyltransferase